MRTKSLLIFLSGAAFGGICTYFGVRNHFQELSEAEIADVRDHYIQKLNEINEGLNGANMSSEGHSESAKEPEIEVNGVEKAAERVNYAEIIHKLDYGKFSTKVKEPDEAISNGTADPYIISIEDYCDDNSFDKVILSYFEEDEVLMDMNGEVLDNGIQIIGAENLEKFGLIDNSEDGVIYVRNELYGTDYEINHEVGSYENYISGE